MNAAHPDLIVADPGGEYLMVVEVKSDAITSSCQSAIGHLQHFRVSLGCAVGLAI